MGTFLLFITSLEATGRFSYWKCLRLSVGVIYCMLVVAISLSRFGSYEATNTSQKRPYIPDLISPCIVVGIHMSGGITVTFDLHLQSEILMSI